MNVSGNTVTNSYSLGILLYTLFFIISFICLVAIILSSSSILIELSVYINLALYEGTLTIALFISIPKFSFISFKPSLVY